MERNRGNVIAVVAALVIAVVSLGVAFATFSTTLNINGTATVQASSWKIYFVPNPSNSTEEPSSATNIIDADILPGNYAGFTSTASKGTTNTVAATTITWNANFKTPGDTIKYTIHVHNDGSYNAQIASTNGINTPTITCTGNETTVCSHLHYKLYTVAPTGDPATTGTELTSSFSVASGQTGTIYLVAWLDKDLDQANLPSTNVVTNTIAATLTFNQVN